MRRSLPFRYNEATEPVALARPVGEPRLPAHMFYGGQNNETGTVVGDDYVIAWYRLFPSRESLKPQLTAA